MTDPFQFSYGDLAMCFVRALSKTCLYHEEINL